MKATAICLLALLALVVNARGQATQPAIPDRAELERRFQETMTGAALVGRSTDSARSDARPSEERYVILRASKVVDPAGGDSDRWMFVCRMQFKGKDVSVPLIIPVKWAGDTPVLSLTDMTIPGLGTYTARVVIYRDRYAGTWSGGNHEGQLWGRIESANATTAPSTQPAAR